MSSFTVLPKSEFIEDDERWELHYGSAPEMIALVERYCFDMNRAVLYTLGGHYLTRMAYIAHRVTLVFKASLLVGFAVINFEKFELPEYVTDWNGTDRLTTTSPDFSHVTKKLHATKKSFDLMHVAAIGCSPYATQGLGSRILTFQKIMARALLINGVPVPFVALEAIKPLNNQYYSKHGFKSTSPSFYPNNTSTNLVPMFYKLLDTDVSKSPEIHSVLKRLNQDRFIRESWDAADRSRCEDMVLPFNWANDARLTELNECGVLSGRIVDFLWNCKSNDDAKEYIRQISVRSSLRLEEILKLWSMRFHSLNYEKDVPMPKVPLTDMGSKSWSEGPDKSILALVPDILRTWA